MNNLYERYIKCLKEELKQKYNEVCKEYNINTIYIGGGTPSLIDRKSINEILDIVKDKDDGAEITVEVNPDSAVNFLKQSCELKENKGCQLEPSQLTTSEPLKATRLSIGLQSTNNDLLKSIGRIHTFEQFIEAYELARKVGFKNINVDLMIGLPNQTINDIKLSLESIINLNPEHISVYSLILEEGTKLYDMVNKRELILPDDELERQMYWYVKNTLELNGYNHYEISNFAKSGFESKHNVNCWKQKEYIGVGLNASSYLKRCALFKCK